MGGLIFTFEWKLVFLSRKKLYLPKSLSFAQKPIVAWHHLPFNRQSPCIKSINLSWLAFIGIPLHRFNFKFWVARLLRCGSNQKTRAMLPILKTVKVGSWTNSRGWSVSSALMLLRPKPLGSRFEPSDGENLTTQSRRRVGACSGIALFWSGKRCKPLAGGDVCLQCVRPCSCRKVEDVYDCRYAEESSRKGSIAREPINTTTWTKQTSPPEGRSNSLEANPTLLNSPDMNLLSAVVFYAN